MNYNLNNRILCQIYRYTMMTIFLTTIFSFSVMLCDGRALTEDLVTSPESIDPTLKPNTSEDLSDLMKAIMEALDSAKLTAEGPTPNQEQVESLVMELSPERRKVLNEILGVVINQQEDNNLYHKAQNYKKPQVSKQIEVFTLPPGRSINIHELLKFLLEPSVTTPSELEHLRKIIYENQMTDLRHDPVLKRTFSKFLIDTNLQSHEIDHLD